MFLLSIYSSLLPSLPLLSPSTLSHYMVILYSSNLWNLLLSSKSSLEYLLFRGSITLFINMNHFTSFYKVWMTFISFHASFLPFHCVGPEEWTRVFMSVGGAFTCLTGPSALSERSDKTIYFLFLQKNFQLFIFLWAHYIWPLCVFFLFLLKIVFHSWEAWIFKTRVTCSWVLLEGNG